MQPEDLIKDNEFKTVKELQARLNRRFFDWLKKILKLDVSRTIQINTFLINLQIFSNYFPWVKAIEPYNPAEKYGLSPEEVKEFRINYERISNIFILITLKYKTANKLSKGMTDKAIDELQRKGPLVRDFFLMNMIHPDIHLVELMKHIEGYILIDTLLPDLGFDPQFEKILNSKAMRSLFDTRFIKEFFQTGQMIHGATYLAPAPLLEELSKSYNNIEKPLFSIDQNLKIAKFLKEFLKNVSILYFGSPQMIDEVISLFIEYYCKRIPSKEIDIKDILHCFGELLKMCEGKGYIEFSWNNLKLKLTRVVSEELAEIFLEYIIMGYLDDPFDYEFNNFDGWGFLQDYHEFLTKAGYYHLGKISTGVFIVWRALIKYLEGIQREEEFIIIKGALLENWCYKQAILHGFKVEKVILINPLQKPDEYYEIMIEQIKDFPKKPLMINVEFPQKLKKYYFREIDLALRVGEYLVLFECKGTSVPIGELGNFIAWINHFNKNMRQLTVKADIIFDNLKNGKISHPFFDGVETIRINQIQTEGLFYKYGVMNIGGFKNFLNDLRNHVDNETLDTLFQ